MARTTPVVSADVEGDSIAKGWGTYQTPSLDDLKDAMWTLHDNVELGKRPTVVQPGLDSLRYAVWGEGDDVRFYVDPAPAAKAPVYPVSSYYSQPEAYTLIYPGEEQECENTTSSLEEDSEEGWTMVENQNPKSRKKTKPDDNLSRGHTVQSKIVALQQKLESCYPECSDLRTKSAEGFQPHLTLGQAASSKVSDMMGKLKASWKTVKFCVDEVHLISRSGPFDPFKIKYSVPLGANISTN